MSMVTAISCLRFDSEQSLIVAFKIFLRHQYLYSLPNNQMIKIYKRIILPNLTHTHTFEASFLALL